MLLVKENGEPTSNMFLNFVLAQDSKLLESIKNLIFKNKFLTSKYFLK